MICMYTCYVHFSSMHIILLWDVQRCSTCFSCELFNDPVLGDVETQRSMAGHILYYLNLVSLAMFTCQLSV